jgi:hypothetical protein
MVTLAVAVAVLVPGAYCTTMVQELPGLITKPDTQVPPAMMEKVPPVVPTLVMDGAVFNVMGPAPVPVAVLLTVMVPVLVVVSGVVVVSAGTGPLKATVPTRVVKPTGLVVPIGVTTATFLVPATAVGAIDRVAFTVVAFTTVNVLTVTPVPVTVTAVAPVRPFPVRTTGTLLVVVPIDVEAGAIEVSVGP